LANTESREQVNGNEKRRFYRDRAVVADNEPRQLNGSSGAWGDQPERAESRRHSWHATVWLAVIGLLLIVADFAENQVLPRLEGSAEATVLPYPPYSWFAPVVSSALPAAPGVPIALAIALLVFFGALYARGLVLAGETRAGPAGLAVILVVVLGCGLVSATAPPSRKSDIFYYAFQGRMIARGGLNPYAVPPRAFAVDPWFPLVSPVWRDLPTGYGPVWLLISEEIDKVSDNGGFARDSVQTILAYRLLFLGATIGSAGAIWLVLRDVAPARRVVGTLAFAWNPVILAVGFEHNDVVMLLFAILGVALFVGRRELPAAVALTLSALVKYFTLPLLIGYLIWRWRSSNDGWTRRLLPLSAALASCALAFAPFDPQSLLARFSTYLTTSGRISHITQLPLEFTFGVAVAMGLRLFAIRRTHRLSQVVEIGVLVLLVYLVVFSRDWFSWYLVTPIGLATLLGGWWLEATAIAGVVWLSGFHGVEAYLVSLLEGGAGLDLSRAISAIFFLPSIAMVVVGALWRWQRWNRHTLLGLGSAIVVAFCLLVESPLISHVDQPPAQADLGGGLAPGPVVLGSALEWDDWSWGVALEQSATTSGPDHLRTLCVSTSGNGGSFFAHHPAFSTKGYSEVDLDVSSDDVPASSLTMTIRDAQGQSVTPVRLAGLTQPVPGDPAWQRVRVPLSALRAVNTSVTGLLIQAVVNPAGRSYCLRGLEFR
jgi:hypothetical protein